MALDARANGDKAWRGGGGGGDDGDGDGGDGDGGDGDGGGEIEEEEVEEEEPLHCVICLEAETVEDDVMLVCCDVKCGQAAHRSCASQRYETPRNTLAVDEADM